MQAAQQGHACRPGHGPDQVRARLNKDSAGQSQHGLTQTMPSICSADQCPGCAGCAQPVVEEQACSSTLDRPHKEGSAHQKAVHWRQSRTSASAWRATVPPVTPRGAGAGSSTSGRAALCRSPSSSRSAAPGGRSWLPDTCRAARDDIVQKALLALIGHSRQHRVAGCGCWMTAERPAAPCRARGQGRGCCTSTPVSEWVLPSSD